MENLIWVLVEIIFAALFTALTFLFVQAFLQRKRIVHKVLKILVPAIVFIMACIMNTLYIESFIVIICVSTFLAFLLGFVFFDVKTYITAIAAFFSTIAGAISEMIAALLVTSTQNVPIGEVTQFTIYRLQGKTVTVLIMLVFILAIKRFRRGRIGSMNTKVMLALCAMPVISTFIALQLVIHLTGSPHAPTLTDMIPIVSIAVLNVIFFIFIENTIRQNEKTQRMVLIEAQNEAQQMYINLLTENQLQIRTMSHDFRQQVHELHTLCKEKKFDILQDKLFTLSGRESTTLLVDTGNIMLDSILTAKIEIINKNKITLKHKFDITPGLDYLGTEICVLLGNALDNAIEACLREAENRFIGVDISATPDQFLCHIINSIGVKPLTDGSNLLTSKKSNLHHGLGLQSMLRVCRELGGTMTYDFDDKNFNLWIEITLRM